MPGRTHAPAGSRVVRLSTLNIHLQPPSASQGRQALLRTTVLVGLVFLVGMIGFYAIGQPQAGLVDAFYMTSITLTTIGYGAVVPVETTAAKLFTSLYAIVGFGMFVYLFSNVTAFMVEGGLDRLLWSRKMHRTIDKLRGHTVVCGSGNTGRHIIAELLETGRPFVLIDGDAEVVRALHQQFGTSFPAVIGDATDDDVLRAAGVPRASGLIACVSNDHDNLVITLSARLLSPKLRIVARCLEEREQAKIRRAGADVVVLPNKIGGIRMVSELVSPHVVTFLDVMLRDKDPHLRVDEVQVPEGSPQTGVTVGQLRAHKIKDLLIVALRDADGTWQYNPEEHDPVRPGMVIVFMGSPEARAALERLLVH